jgi:GR25 family glycosyltransferase involved in LPS biosynthesis
MSISIGILASNVDDKYKKQIECCLDNWVKIAKEKNIPIFFFGGYIQYSHPLYINLPTAEDKQSDVDKQFYGLSYLYKNNRSDFYLIVDSSVFVHVDNLLSFISNLEKKDNLYIGSHGGEIEVGNRKFQYHGSGGGFILSANLVEKLVDKIEYIKKDWASKTGVPNTRDIILAYYLGDCKIITSKLLHSCDYRGSMPQKNSCCTIDRKIDITYNFMTGESAREIIHGIKPEFDFYYHLDSFGYDIRYEAGKSIDELKELCKKDKNCIGFNSLGYMKYHINPKEQWKMIPHYKTLDDGLYIYHERYEKMLIKVKNDIVVKSKPRTKLRVKMLCNWVNSKQLCEEWNHMSKGNYCWDNIEITWENDVDFYVVINKTNEYFVPERTIVFHMEPWCGDSNQNWGVKTWGEWAEPKESKFLQVRSHKNFYNNAFWQLKATYQELKTEKIIKTKLLSSICSSKYFDPGHIKRIDFLKYIENKNDDIVRVDIYNTDNNHQFKSYVGPHPKGNKDVGITPYKYYFMAENNDEHNFITEKIWESLVTETLCFYWGCSNISDWINPKAYIVLNLDNFEEAFQTVKQAIINNEWEKRIEVIRQEKQKVLEYFNFFPTLQRVLVNDFKFNLNPTDDDIIYHKYFNNFIGQKINNITFIHSCNLDGGKILNETLTKITETGLVNRLDYIMVVNIGAPLSLLSTNKIKIIQYDDNTQLFEKPTINLIKIFSQYHRKVKILYLHTKGITQPDDSKIIDWKEMMFYYLVEKHQQALALLDFYDTVGCNYQDNPNPHYSGNFWWANSNYLATLPPISSNNRHDCEWWIMKSNPNKYVCHNSNVDHYQENYPKEKYVVPDEEFKLKIKCVNLLRRPDRKTMMTKILREVGLINNCQFFNAVNGKELQITEEIKNLFDNNDFGSRPGFIGCALSHLTLWKELLDDDCDEYLIIEDDIEMDSNIKEKLKIILQIKQNYDIFYIGHSVNKRLRDKYESKIKDNYIIEKFDRFLSVGGTFGYIIKKSGAKKLIDFIEKNGIKHGIDYVMIQYAPVMNMIMLEILPQIIKTDYVDGNNVVDSDIQYDNGKLF